MKDLPEIIRAYLEAYRSFDIENMLGCLDDNIRFTNIQEGVTNVDILGRDAFERLARESATIFSARRQKPNEMRRVGNHVFLDVVFTGTFARDVGPGMMAGATIEIAGRSSSRLGGGFITEIVDAS